MVRHDGALGALRRLLYWRRSPLHGDCCRNVGIEVSFVRRVRVFRRRPMGGDLPYAGLLRRREVAANRRGLTPRCLICVSGADPGGDRFLRLAETESDETVDYLCAPTVGSFGPCAEYCD